MLFNYTTIMSTYYKVSSGAAPAWIVPFAIGNFLGPLLLGRLFDTVGRRPMIAGCYLVSAALFVVMALMFGAGSLTKVSQVVAWVLIFFFASATQAGFVRRTGRGLYARGDGVRSAS